MIGVLEILVALAVIGALVAAVALLLRRAKRRRAELNEALSEVLATKESDNIEQFLVFNGHRLKEDQRHYLNKRRSELWFKGNSL